MGQKSKTMSNKDMIDLISNRTDRPSKTVTSIVDCLINVIGAELQLRGEINVKNLGRFELVDEDGFDYCFNAFGFEEKVKLDDSAFSIKFTPAKNFTSLLRNYPLSVLSDDQLEAIRNEKRNELYSYLDIEDREEMVKSSRPDKDVLLDEIINNCAKRKERARELDLERRKGIPSHIRKKRNCGKGHVIYCRTNGHLYESAAEMARYLNITEKRVRYAIQKKRNYIDGYQFDVLE